MKFYRIMDLSLPLNCMVVCEFFAIKTVRSSHIIQAQMGWWNDSMGLQNPTLERLPKLAQMIGIEKFPLQCLHFGNYLMRRLRCRLLNLSMVDK